MGSFLLCGGSKGRRLALPHSRVMIHQPAAGGIQGQASDIRIEAEHILGIRDRVVSHAALVTRAPVLPESSVTTCGMPTRTPHTLMMPSPSLRRAHAPFLAWAKPTRGRFRIVCAAGVLLLAAQRPAEGEGVAGH